MNVDIEKMGLCEWLEHRADQIAEIEKMTGKKLVPTVGCSDCDPQIDSVCFFCECAFIDLKGEIK